MKNKKFFLILSTILTVFTLSGCSPEYLNNWGSSTYNQGDYLYSVGCYKGLISQKPDDTKAHYWLAKSYLAAGDADRAADYFNKVIESDSAETSSLKADTYISLGMASYKNGEYQKALGFYKKANENTPGTDLQNLNLYTDIYDMNNQISAAIDLHKRANYAPAYVSRQYRILSYLYNRDHNYEEAAKMGVKAVEAFPDNELAYYLIGISSGQRGYYDKAIEAIRKAAKIDYSGLDPQERFPMYISLAYYLTKNGQYDEAIAAYNQAIQVASSVTSYNNYTFVMAKSLAYYNAGKYDEALYTVNKFITPLEKGKVGIYLRDSKNLRSSYGDSNYYVFDVVKNSPAEKAGIQFGDKIIAVNGLSTKGWSVSKIVENLSGVEGTKVTLKIQSNIRFNKHFNKKKLKKEISEKTLVREHLNSNKQNQDLANSLGIRSLIYRAKGDNNKAFVDAQKAHVLYPDAVNVMLAYGLSKIDKGDYVAALDTLTQIQPGMYENVRRYDISFINFFVPFPSDEEHLKLGKAIAYAKLGRINEVVGLIPQDDKISQLPPLSNDYKTLSLSLNQIAEAHAEKALYFEKNGDLKAALAEYTVAVAFTSEENKIETIKNNIFNIVHQLPGLPQISEDTRKFMIRADVLHSKNDLQGCLREYKNALKSAPYLPKLYYNTAVIYGELKNYDKAISHMKSYIDLAPEAPNVQDAKDEITKWELLSEKTPL